MSWIKYSTTLHDKPRVQRIADDLGISRFDVAGRLCAVWAWAATMTEDGRISFGSLKQIDRAAEIEGFGEAMRAVGWLDQEGDDLLIPGWEEHHSKSAKKRAQTAKRNSKWRDSPDSKVTKRSRDATSVTDASPREDKRREDKTHTDARESVCPIPYRQIDFEGEIHRIGEVAPMIIARSEWPKPRADRKADRLIEGILAAMDERGVADPIGTLGQEMGRYVKTQRATDDPDRFTKFLSNWLAEQFSDLIDERGNPIEVAHVA